MSLLLELGRRVSSPAAGRLRAALENPRAAQERVRRRLGDAMAGTAYGRHLGLGSADDWDRVPLVDYDQLSPWIERQKVSRERVLTPDPALFWERTSGSTAPAKFIPYTAPLRQAFTEMFLAWVHDVLEHGPPLGRGRLYAAVTPSLRAPGRTAAGQVVGTEDERDFLEGWAGWLLSPFLLRSGHLARERDPARFRRRLGRMLLAARDLEVISVWSPSFLQVMLDDLEANRAEYAQAKAAPTAAAARHLRAHGTDWTAVWPRLSLVSCWDAGWARPQADWLRARLRGVAVQGKGLLATEGPVTLPLLGAPGPVPLVHQVLVELLDEDGRLGPLVEARPGRTYELVLSQPAGLLRYRLGDRVRMVGQHLATPCLDFVGRGAAVSDMVGEKLHEDFVAQALDGLGIEAAFFRTLVPVLGPPARYRLVLDRCPRPPGEVAAALDRALSAAHHYQQARLLGQLAPAEVEVDPGALERFAAAAERAGVRRGDQKQRLLQTLPVPAPPRPGGRSPGALPG